MTTRRARRLTTGVSFISMTISRLVSRYAERILGSIAANPDDLSVVTASRLRVASEEDEPMGDPEQTSFFDEDAYENWAELWKGMPEFVQEDLAPVKSVIVHFATLADQAAFAKLVEQRIGPRTQSIWFPEAEIGHFADKRYADEP